MVAQYILLFAFSPCSQKGWLATDHQYFTTLCSDQEKDIVVVDSRDLQSTVWDLLEN